MAHRTASRTWLTTAALIAGVALTGCGGGTTRAPEAAPSGSTPAAASSSPQTDSAELYELTETYTDPAEVFTVKYPRDWTAKQNRGYLELTSPDGKVTGSIASTDVRSPSGDWFTRPTHPLIGDETRLSDQVDDTVHTYSSYLPTPAGANTPDSVLWGLTGPDNKGLVTLPGSQNRGELWAEFSYAPVNEGNPPLNQRQGVALVHEINQTDDAGAVDAILKSVRLHQK